MHTLTLAADKVTSHADWLIAIGTVATAGVAVGALIVTICSARADRSAAAKRLEDEQQHHAKRLADEQQRHWDDLVRADHLRYLLETAEQYARHRAAEVGESARTEAEARLQLLLRLLPHDNAILLRRKFGVELTGKETARLNTMFPAGIPAPDEVPEKRIYAELADNADSISHYGRR